MRQQLLVNRLPFAFGRGCDGEGGASVGLIVDVGALGGAADEGLAGGDEAGALHTLHLHPAAAVAAELKRLCHHPSCSGMLARSEVPNDDGLPVPAHPWAGGD